jgi:NADPH-dependent curcumin reductase CurA
MIFKKRLWIEGFLVPDLTPRLAPRFYAEMPPLVAAGTITAREHIIDGLENGPDALLAVLREGEGMRPLGKPVILVARE